MRSRESLEPSLPARLWAPHTGEVLPGWSLPSEQIYPSAHQAGKQLSTQRMIYHRAEQTINSGIIYWKITKWIDITDLQLLNLATHTEGCSAWNPRGRNPYECGECKARSGLDYSKAMDAKLCYGHTSTTFPQFTMALFTAWVALTQILDIDRKSHGRLNDTLSVLCTWVNRYALEFVTGIITFKM